MGNCQSEWTKLGRDLLRRTRPQPHTLPLGTGNPKEVGCHNVKIIESPMDVTEMEGTKWRGKTIDWAAWGRAAKIKACRRIFPYADLFWSTIVCLQKCLAKVPYRNAKSRDLRCVKRTPLQKRNQSHLTHRRFSSAVRLLPAWLGRNWAPLSEFLQVLSLFMNTVLGV